MDIDSSTFKLIFKEMSKYKQESIDLQNTLKQILEKIKILKHTDNTNKDNTNINELINIEKLIINTLSKIK